MQTSVLRIACAVLTPFAWRQRRAGSGLARMAREYQAGMVSITSPADERAAVLIAVGLASKAEGRPEDDFRKSIDQAVAGLDGDMKLTQRSGARTFDGVLMESLKINVQGLSLDLTVTAYPVGRGEYMTLMIMYPSQMDDKDRRVTQALDVLATAITRKFTLCNPRDFDRTAPVPAATTVYDNSRSAPAQAAPLPPPPSARPAQQAGKRCERCPIWGFRVSYWCQPSGICNDRVIKGYETACEYMAASTFATIK